MDHINSIKTPPLSNPSTERDKMVEIFSSSHKVPFMYQRISLFIPGYQ